MNATALQNLSTGQVVKFTYKAERSHEPIQNVELRVEEVSGTHLRGINVNRILDGSADSLPFRTYKIANIIPNTVYVKIA